MLNKTYGIPFTSHEQHVSFYYYLLFLYHLYLLSPFRIQPHNTIVVHPCSVNVIVPHASVPSETTLHLDFVRIYSFLTMFVRIRQNQLKAQLIPYIDHQNISQKNGYQ